MKKRVSFYTFGCRLNQSETSSLENDFIRQGYDVVDIKETSDIVVINTCTVTENGDADTRRMVSKVNRLHPQARIALVGCQAQVQKELLASLPNVSWVVGNERKMDLVKVFDEHPAPLRAEVITPTINRSAFTMPVAAIDRSHRRANLKIQDGCDFFCTFCEIPYARGRARSRIFEDIIQEAKILATAGHKEIILTGINIGTYKERDFVIMDVLKALGEIDPLKRIRISSIEPTTIPHEIFQLMKKGKICRYLHVPLQSGHDAVLQDMGRKYSIKEFSDFVENAHATVEGICLGTDVIVGFPSETNAHFDATVDFLRESLLHYFHVFSYSPRHMAKSRLSNSLPAITISNRSQILRELSLRKKRAFHETLLGQKTHVLCEQHVDGHWEGFTDNYVKVKFPSSRDLMNELVLVRFIKAENHAIVGEMC